MYRSIKLIYGEKGYVYKNLGPDLRSALRVNVEYISSVHSYKAFSENLSTSSNLHNFIFDNQKQYNILLSQYKLLLYEFLRASISTTLFCDLRNKIKPGIF